MVRSLEKRTHHRVLGHLAVSALFLLAGLATTRILIFLQGSAGGTLFRSAEVADATDDDPDIDPKVADVGYTPEQVVELQIRSIQNSLTDPEKLRVCYSLASPANRSMTGPIARFAEMVVAPPYDQLALAKDWQVGKAEVKGIYAVVLATATSDDDIHAFRFMLRQQSDAPYENIWMTEGVEPLSQISFNEAGSNTEESPRDAGDDRGE